MEDIFKPTIRNKNLHEISDDNGVRIVNFAILKNLTVNGAMFPHRNIHEFTWTSPEGKMHNQIVMIYKLCKLVRLLSSLVVISIK
jgi:hypothetical protein